LHSPRGAITPEMEVIACGRGADAAFVRDEVPGAGHHPSHVNHPQSGHMIIGSRFLVQVNANLRATRPFSSSVYGGGFDKLRWATQWGADTVWISQQAQTSQPTGSGSSETVPSPSGPSRSTRPWEKVDGDEPPRSMGRVRDHRDRARKGRRDMTYHDGVLPIVPLNRPPG